MRSTVMKKDVLLILGVFLAFLVGNNTLGNSTTLDTHNVKTVTVKSGDSLWSIAAQTTPSNIDIRDMVYAMKNINQLENNVEIQPGMKLRIPTITNGQSRDKLGLDMAQN